VNNWRRRFVRQGLVTGAVTAGVALLITAPAGAVIERQTLFIAFPLLLVIVLLGVIFDIIGVAVPLTAEAPLHAMAAKRAPAARTAIRLVRHGDRVASICCDIVGDLAGTISGAAGAAIAVRLASLGYGENALISLIMVAAIAGLTVGGKAAGKGVAINYSASITMRVAAVLHVLENLFHFEVFAGRTGRPRGKQGNGRGSRNHKR